MTTDETPTPQPSETPAPPANADKPLRDRVIDAICTIFDPEIPVNIWELGLIYELRIDDELGDVSIDMTLTSPACPVAESLPGDVERRVREVPGVENVTMALVWDPPWDKDKLSDAAKLQLGLM